MNTSFIIEFVQFLFSLLGFFSILFFLIRKRQNKWPIIIATVSGMMVLILNFYVPTLSRLSFYSLIIVIPGLICLLIREIRKERTKKQQLENAYTE